MATDNKQKTTTYFLTFSFHIFVQSRLPKIRKSRAEASPIEDGDDDNKDVAATDDYEMKLHRTRWNKTILKQHSHQLQKKQHFMNIVNKEHYFSPIESNNNNKNERKRSEIRQESVLHTLNLYTTQHNNRNKDKKRI